MHVSRKPLVAGNWKMHHGGPTGLDLAGAIGALAREVPHVEVVVAPPFTVLAAAASELEETPVGLAAQNLHVADKGAFTGEVSGPMLRDAGCAWVIVGHSERRQLFGETDALVAEKAAAAYTHGLVPIVCVGETLEERESGKTLAVVERQIGAVLDVLVAHADSAVVAYEPVWAIGTGKTAGPAEAQEVHAAIRRQLAGKAPNLAATARILYGGSVKGDNAAALLGEADVDGALVGGASLEAASFGAIARAAERIAASS